MSVELNNEQVQVVEVEMSNVVAMINTVLNQISADCRSTALAEVALNPVLDAFYRSAAAEEESLRAAVEDAIDLLRRELGPEEAEVRCDEIAVNCELRVNLVETTRDTLQDLLSAGQQAEAQRVLVDFQAALRDLGANAVALCDRPAAEIVEVVTEWVNEEMSAMDVGQDNWADLDADAVARLCTVAAQWVDQTPRDQLSAMKGAVMEELVGVAAQRFADELNRWDPAATYRFFPGGSLADRTDGLFGALSDGFIGRLNDQGTWQVLWAFEAKAGEASARDLHHRKGKPTEQGLQEARDVLADTPDGSAQVGAEKLNARREFAGQLESTRARLDCGEVFVHGERWWQEQPVLVTGCVPQDVAPENDRLQRVAMSAAQVAAVSQRLLDAFTTAQADKPRRAGS
jgi:hypothetical protein